MSVGSDTLGFEIEGVVVVVVVEVVVDVVVVFSSSLLLDHSLYSSSVCVLTEK